MNFNRVNLVKLLYGKVFWSGLVGLGHDITDWANGNAATAAIA
jgi:hypothetical protein